MRIFYIDLMRFLAIFSMIIYHLLYDMKYVFSFDMPWFDINSWYFFQQYICISFIFISGISTNLSKKLSKNAMVLLFLSIIITTGTSIISKDYAIYFGVIHLLCLCTITVILISKYTDKINPCFMFWINIILFVILKSKVFAKNPIFLEIYDRIKNIPLAFIFGFYKEDFESADYFPYFPWIFLFMAGRYFFRINILNINSITKKTKIIEYISKNSLKIYMLHQIVLFLILSAIVKIV